MGSGEGEKLAVVGMVRGKGIGRCNGEE